MSSAIQQNLITLLGLEDLPDREKFELLDHATTVVLKRAYLKIIDSLTDEQKDRVGRAAAQNDAHGSQALMEVLNDVAPDRIQTLIEQEAAKLKEELKDEADHVKVQMQTAAA